MNELKTALTRNDVTFGLWVGLASPAVSIIASNAGFDWVLVDCEHGPIDLARLEAQLMALHGHPAHVVVRVPKAEDWIIKQALDLGAETLLIPMINTVEDAKAAIAACKYPPQGIRGMGAPLARASNYNFDKDYVARANEEVCVILQLETVEALNNLEAIAALDGVDALFIGPADLAGDMGYPGQAGVAEVTAAVDDGLARIHAAGLPSGLIAFAPEDRQKYSDMGVNFIGAGADTTTIQAAFVELAQSLPK